MDVRCQKCGIEYEFDDDKVTSAGVTVQCTNCQHVFKVKPGDVGNTVSASVSLAPPVAADAEWMVRRVDGTMLRCRELTTLQKWIVERKVTRAAAISKTGRTWKVLGDIAELESFFQVVDAANAAEQANRGTALPTPPPAESGSPLTPLLPPVAPVHDVASRIEPPVLETGASVLPTAAFAASASTPLDDAALAAFAKNLDNALDADDPVAQWGRRRRGLRVAIVGLVIVGVTLSVLVAVGVLRTPASTAPERQRVQAALVADDDGALRAAAAGLGNASSSPLHAALLARVRCAEGVHAAELARIENLLVALDADNAAEHLKLRDAAGNRADLALAEAYPLLTRVRAEAPDIVDGHLAAAAYNRQKGGYLEHTADLENARLQGQRLPVAARADLDSEIGVAQALADAQKALRSDVLYAPLRESANKVPTGDDARLRYARAALLVTALAASDAPPTVDVAEANKAVDALAPADARVVALRAVVAAAKLRAQKAAAAAVEQAATAAADAAASDTNAKSSTASTSMPMSFESAFEGAEHARKQQSAARARDLYMAALKVKPTAARAWLGLGWSNLDLNKKADAVQAFDRALALEPALHEALFGRAEALRFAGRIDDAKAAYRLYLERAPGGRDAPVAKNALEALQ